MTKPSTSTSSCSQHQHLNVGVAMVMDETEFEVAEILLQLPQLIFESESFHRSSFSSWGRKRRRSSKAETPTLPPLGPTCEIEKPKALSPATPLLFSPSESDDKFKHSKRKVSVKRTKEECLEKIKELTERKEFFKEEIKNVQRYYDEQKLLNLRLKAKKQMLILGLPKEESQSQSSINSAAVLDIQVEQQQQQNSYLVHHPPLMMDDTAHRKACGETVGSGVCLFDLNLLPEESCGIEAVNVRGVDKSERKALAAEARHRRIQIWRSKNPNVKLRYPICR
ncbi:uncharacterized protein LOC116141902 [Pistacia vera]|uniref:uncharacterized protein LOC116141902 n=1 Tax=Pistacia vera TaxID=55513 RepID=UPI001263DDB9|nr:uncharacterized protein LOC116141902 [Pistacia vera]